MREADTGDSTVWKKGQVILGEYVVEGELGEGGMGTVYLLVRSQATGQRFAVKKTRFRNKASQRNFLNELQTWLDLPEHPHLVACRFFRTVGEELAIFADMWREVRSRPGLRSADSHNWITSSMSRSSSPGDCIRRMISGWCTRMSSPATC